VYRANRTTGEQDANDYAAAGELSATEKAGHLIDYLRQLWDNQREFLKASAPSSSSSKAEFCLAGMAGLWRSGSHPKRLIGLIMPKTLMQAVVAQLQKERTRLEDELHRVTAALTAFGQVYMHGKPKAVTRKKRTLSAAGRRRIAAAQRARWAKVRASKKKQK
jgi:hypothetical protein